MNVVIAKGNYGPLMSMTTSLVLFVKRTGQKHFPPINGDCTQFNFNVKKNNYGIISFMILIVGLGNPGSQYKNTPHNMGFRLVEYLARDNKLGSFVYNKKLDAMTVKTASLFGSPVSLVLPQTYMNQSGKVVRKFKGKYHSLIVAHDDIDLPLGKIKFSFGAGAAGHKGVQSIIDSLGTRDFQRMRLGVMPSLGKPDNVEEYVVKKFAAGENEALNRIIEGACRELEVFLQKTAGPEGSKIM